MKEHFVRPNCSQTRLAVLYKPSCIYNALFIDVGFVTLFAQNTTVETRALYVTCLPLLAKVLKSFTQSYSKRDAPKQQQSLRTRMGHFSASLLCHRHKPLPAKPQPTWPSGVGSSSTASWLGVFGKAECTAANPKSHSHWVQARAPLKMGVLSARHSSLPVTFALSQTIGLFFFFLSQKK